MYGERRGREQKLWGIYDGSIMTSLFFKFKISNFYFLLAVLTYLYSPVRSHAPVLVEEADVGESDEDEGDGRNREDGRHLLKAKTQE